MSRRIYWLIAASMFAIGAAVRVNNALVFSPLRAYDGYGHFSYIWFMAENWRIPLPTSGWGFFQPPLYYALMAGLWDALPKADPLLRLKLGTMVIALLGLVHAWASLVVARRVLPGNRLAHLAAAGLILFVPVHLYSAGFLGNEYLCAAFCSLSLLVLLKVLDQPTLPRALILGLCLGAAMLTKFTGLVVVVAAFATLGARTVLRREFATGFRTMTAAAIVLLLSCGWFYGHNVMLYGTPFKMSRETFVVSRYENVQARGRRTIWEYVLFDPLILRRPEWPRGGSLVQQTPRPFPYSAARESVLTGMYANTWFDGYGGWVLPPITADDTVRHCGQFLMTFGLVPSLLILVGFADALARLWRRGWNDGLVTMVISSAAMLVVVVHGTRSVPTHAAVKATYLFPVSVVFAVWFALGIDWVQRTYPRLLRPLVASCVLLATVSATVFLQGHTVARDWFDDARLPAVWRSIYGNINGVVYHAGGDDVRARQLLQSVADAGNHLGFENLAVLDLERHPRRALREFRHALKLQPAQSFGLPADRERFNRTTAAEYRNSMAVIYHRLGRPVAAEREAQKAVELDPTFPEAAYDLAVLVAEKAIVGESSRDEAARRAAIARSRQLLSDTLAMDPAFVEARRLAAALDAFDGRCDEAAAAQQALEGRRAPRIYPVDTGIGDMLAASIKRRRHITKVPAALTPEVQIARCRAARDGRILP